MIVVLDTVLNIVALALLIYIITIPIIVYRNYRKVWVINTISKDNYMPQKVNHKLLKGEIKYLKENDVYNLFVIYDDLGMEFTEKTDIQDVIAQNRKADKPLDIKYNEYTRSYHICYKDHYKKVINEKK